jgi:hypothetical protein
LSHRNDLGFLNSKDKSTNTIIKSTTIHQSTGQTHLESKKRCKKMQNPDLANERSKGDTRGRSKDLCAYEKRKTLYNTLKSLSYTNPRYKATGVSDFLNFLPELHKFCI